MSGVDQLFSPERLRSNWEASKRVSDAALEPPAPQEEEGIPGLFKKLKEDIQATWQGEKADVLLSMHERLESLAAEEPSDERDQAIVELLDTIETLIDVYGMTV